MWWSRKRNIEESKKYKPGDSVLVLYGGYSGSEFKVRAILPDGDLLLVSMGGTISTHISPFYVTKDYV